MRRAFTLLEIILVIAISSILTTATFKALKAIYIHSAKSRAITELSLESQSALDQIGVMLYNRVLGSTIGYSPSSNSCESIYDLSQTHPILEWIGVADSELINRKYDSFANLDSKRPILEAYNIDSSLKAQNYALIFAGELESGVGSLRACEGAYGWHGNDSNLTYTFTIPKDNTIEFNSGDTPNVIYEKYYLTKSAYAIARGADIDREAKCIKDLLDSGIDIDDNTLLLFYDYKPWRGETFCADINGDTKEGNVTILAKYVNSFRAIVQNGVIRVGLDMNKSINGSNSIHISKEKVVF